MTATDTSTVVLGDTLYSHDANGNLTSDATFIYQYDTANQLTNVIRKADNITILSCRYDALGRRVEAIRADGTVDRYVYFPGSFLVLAVLDEANAPKEFYTRGPDLSGTLASAGGIGGILACTYASAPTAPLYHHADLTGNIILLTDSFATLAATIHYTPFGQLISCVGCVEPRHLFASKEGRYQNRFSNFGYRYYMTGCGRWMTRDLVYDNVNTYGFSGNNPLNKVDFFGLSAFDCKNECTMGSKRLLTITTYLKYRERQVGNATLKKSSSVVSDIGVLGAMFGVQGVTSAALASMGASSVALAGADATIGAFQYPGLSPEVVENAGNYLDGLLQQSGGVVMWVNVKWDECTCKTCWYWPGKEYMDWIEREQEVECNYKSESNYLNGWSAPEPDFIESARHPCMKEAVETIFGSVEMFMETFEVQIDAL